MNVGLGDTELLNKEVQGDIDHNFFDEPESKVGEKIGNEIHETAQENLNSHSETKGTVENGAIAHANGEVKKDNIIEEEYKEGEKPVKKKKKKVKYDENIEQLFCFLRYQANANFDEIVKKLPKEPDPVKYSELLKEYGLSDVDSSLSPPSSVTTVSPLTSDDEGNRSFTSNGFNSDEEVEGNKGLEGSINCKNVAFNVSETSNENNKGIIDANVEAVSSIDEAYDADEDIFEDKNVIPPKCMKMQFLVDALNDLDDKSECQSGVSSACGRKNMSFSNDACMKIEKENNRLLNKLNKIKESNGKNTKFQEFKKTSVSNVSSAALNRQKEQKRIEDENIALLKRLKNTKPGKEVSKNVLMKEYDKTRNYGITVEASRNQKSVQSSRPISPSNSSSNADNSDVKSPDGKSKKNRPDWSSRW